MPSSVRLNEGYYYIISQWLETYADNGVNYLSIRGTTMY